MTASLAQLSALELSRLYGEKSVSPVEVVEAVIGNYERLNPQLNAYRVFVADEAMDAARASEQRWMKNAPLSRMDGVPFGTKDMIQTRGLATLFGSHSVSPDQEWEHDAPAVARLREGGAILLGKTTTSEFGWKGTADSALTGITRNPWNLECTSGGSSGGAAAAAAVGMGPLQLGTDGGGSLRIPTSFCGVFGFKATFGRIPAWPPGPMHTLSNVGPITRSVDDARFLMNFISRPDSRDWHALPMTDTDYLAWPAGDLKGMKIGFCFQAGSFAVDQEIESKMRELAGEVEGLGAEIEEIGLDWDFAKQIFVPHWHAGARFLVQSIAPQDRELVDDGLKTAAQLGSELSIDDYQRAIVNRQKLGASFQAVFEDYDAVITPTMPISAFKAGELMPEGRDCESWIDWNPFTYPFNLTRQPAASLPIGLTRERLPVGAQIVGALYSDARVLALARMLESLRPQERPPIVH